PSDLARSGSLGDQRSHPQPGPGPAPFRGAPDPFGQRTVGPGGSALDGRRTEPRSGTGAAVLRRLRRGGRGGLRGRRPEGATFAGAGGTRDPRWTHRLPYSRTATGRGACRGGGPRRGTFR